MAHLEHPSPAALEALYKVAIRDTLDQSLHRRHTEDLKALRQAAADTDRTLATLQAALTTTTTALTAAQQDMGALRSTCAEVQQDLGALRGAHTELRAANQLLRDQLREHAAAQAADKKALRILDTHVRQVDDRQSALELAQEQAVAAFNNAADTMHQEDFSSPFPFPPRAPQQQQQRLRQLISQNDVPEGMADMGPDNKEPLAAIQEEPSLPVQRKMSLRLPPQPRGKQVVVPKTPLPNYGSSKGKQVATKDLGEVNPRYKAFRDHYNETERKHSEAGEMSKAKEVKFLWAFLDGIRDDETCKWFQNVLLEKLPSSMVSAVRRKNSRRILRLRSDITWDAVVRYGLRSASTPPFMK